MKHQRSRPNHQSFNKPCFGILAVCFDIRVDKMGIAMNGKIPWNIPKDRKMFRQTTCQVKDINKKNVVLMGRKTWKSLPKDNRPLKNRINIVLSRSLNSKPFKKINGNEVHFLTSIQNAVRLCNKRRDIESIFVIGGSSLFNTFVTKQLFQSIYITRLYTFFDCDTFIVNMEKEDKHYDFDRSYSRYNRGIQKEQGISFLVTKYYLIDNSEK